MPRRADPLRAAPERPWRCVDRTPGPGSDELQWFQSPLVHAAQRRSCLFVSWCRQRAEYRRQLLHFRDGAITDPSPDSHENRSTEAAMRARLHRCSRAVEGWAAGSMARVAMRRVRRVFACGRGSKPSAYPSRGARRRNSVARFVSFFLEESRAEPVDNPAQSGLAARMARHIFSEVAGISIAGAPTLASASLTAFITAEIAPSVPASPTPLAPNGLRSVNEWLLPRVKSQRSEERRVGKSV